MDTTHGLNRHSSERLETSNRHDTAVGRRNRPIATATLAVLAVLAAFAVAACGDQASNPSPASSTPALTSPALTSPAVTATSSDSSGPMTGSSGPMTGDELVWLEAVGSLHKTMDTVSPTITPATMRSLANTLGGCTRTLDALASRTDRLRPVYELAQQGCVEYEKASRCFATAAGLGVVVAGSAADRQQRAALDCAFAAIGEGSRRFAEAEVKGFEIKQSAQ